MNNKQAKQDSQADELKTLRIHCLNYLSTTIFCGGFLVLFCLNPKGAGLVATLPMGLSVVLSWYVFLNAFQKYLEIKNN